MPTGKQDEKGAPIIENPNFPRMGDRPAQPELIEGNTFFMAQDPKQEPTAEPQNLMAPVPKPTDQASTSGTQQGFPEQQAPKASEQKPTSGEKYVRLHLHVEKDQISVVGVREVEGPLTMSD